MIELSEHFEMVTKDNPDGSMDISIRYDDVFKKAICGIHKRKRCTKKLVKEFFEGAFDFMEKMYGDKIPREWNEQENK